MKAETIIAISEAKASSEHLKFVIRNTVWGIQIPLPEKKPYEWLPITTRRTRGAREIAIEKFGKPHWNLIFSPLEQDCIIDIAEAFADQFKDKGSIYEDKGSILESDFVPE